MIRLAHTAVLAVCALFCVAAHAQQSTPPAADWSYSATASTYVVPDDRNYIEAVITADRRWLHLEGRYNYEALDTGSAWIGYNFGVGSKVVLQVTPMAGVVFGRTAGIAPGERITLNWRAVELYSEAELLFSTHENGSFVYTWSELTLTPVHWLRVGLVGQRTRVYQTERNLQRGFLVGWVHKRAGITANVFNPDKQNSLYVFSAYVEF